MTYQINPSGPYFQWSDLPSLNSGDVVEFLRGYTYEKYDLDGLSGVTIGSYGTGTQPKFSTLRTAVLTSIGSNLYECVDAELGAYLNMLILDGSPRKKGRFPKIETEYYTIPSDSSDGSLNHGSLPFTATGEVVIRLQSFVTNTYTVTADSGGIISFTGHTGQYPPKAEYGFSLQNQIECLTEHGDWMYDSGTKKITIYLTGAAVVQYPIVEENITITNCDNITFEGLVWEGSNGDGINISGSQDIAFTDCNTIYSGGMGIRLEDGTCDDFTFTNVRVDHAFAGGFYAFFGCDRPLAINCTAKNIGMIEGGSRYMNYDGRSNGFCFEGGDENSYQNCLAEDTGFNGFVYNGNGTQVLNNVAKRFCAKKSDGGGFYTYAGNPGATITDPIIVTQNIALDGIGNAFGTPDETPNCQGFYFDDGTNGINATGNLSANNPTGYYLHNTRNNTISENFAYGNTRQLRMNNDNGMTMTGNTYSDNWHIVTEINQEMVSTYGTDEEIAAFGTFANNRYSNFKTGRPVFSTWDGSEPKPYRYSINPSVHFAMLGETGQTFEEYEVMPYTIGTQLGTVNYQTTEPAFGQFGYISGITPTYDENGAVITKVGSPKTVAFIRLGATQASQWYLANGDCLGDFDDLQVDLELNYVSPASLIQNGKIDSTEFAIPLYSSNTRATDQFYLLMEVPFSSISFANLTFSEITVSRETSLAAIEIDEENQTWEIALDGEFPEIPDVTFPSGSFTYDGSEKTLAIVGTLPDGYSVEYTNNGRTNVGTQVVTATITNGVDEDIILEADLTITPATITGITFEDASFVYDGSEKEILIGGSIPSGTSVAYLNNTRTEVGTQEATATISGSNYTTLILYADLTITSDEVGEDEIIELSSPFTTLIELSSPFTTLVELNSQIR